jgi:hypothetical protein
LILGTVYSELLKKKFYKSSMVLNCDYLNTQILKNTIEKLNLLCEEDDREGLANELGIDLETARNIDAFEFRPFVSEDNVVEMEVLRAQLNSVASDKKEIIDKVIDKLNIENKDAYEISVYVYDPKIVKGFENTFVKYFVTNDYIKHRIEINKTSLHERKRKLVSELQKLDSLKSILYQNYSQVGKTSKGSGNVFLGDEKLANPLEVFREDFLIYKELQGVERELYIQTDFEVIDGFTTFQEPESASLAQILFFSFWLSIVMGYLIIGAWRFDRMLANYPLSK